MVVKWEVGREDPPVATRINLSQSKLLTLPEL